MNRLDSNLQNIQYKTKFMQEASSEPPYGYCGSLIILKVTHETWQSPPILATVTTGKECAFTHTYKTINVFVVLYVCVKAHSLSVVTNRQMMAKCTNKSITWRNKQMVAKCTNKSITCNKRQTMAKGYSS